MQVRVFCIVFVLSIVKTFSQTQYVIKQEMRQVPLGEALTRMEKISSYRFFFNNRLVPIDDLVDVHPGPFFGVVDSLLTAFALQYKVLENNAIIIEPMPKKGRIRTITGIIRDERHLPVSSVSVLSVRSNKRLISAQDGTFEVSDVVIGDTLKFSHLRFRTHRLVVDERSHYDVALEPDIRGIEEVVVVGYGTQSRFTTTGSVSTVSREEIIRTPSASIQNAFTGKLPGLFSQQRSGIPGKDGAQVFVRGVSTFTGNQQPLILVDDIEYSYDQFSTLDPNEVESIAILKDAATTAVYGIKGANGVILVTTRRGVAGPARINAHAAYGMQRPTHVPEFLGAYQIALLRNESLANEGRPPEFSEESLVHFRDGTDPYGHPDVDWYDVLFRDSSPITTAGLDISGGSDRLRYMVSLGYVRQDGMLERFNKNEDLFNNNYYYNRYNFRSNLDIDATNSLSFRLDISGNFGERNTPYFHGQSGAGEIAVFAEISRYNMLNAYMYPVYNPDGSYGYADPDRMVPVNSANNIVGRIAYGGYSRERQNLLNFNLSGTQKLDVVTTGLSLRGAISARNVHAVQRQLTRRDFPSFFYNPQDGSYTPRDISVNRVLPWETSYDEGNPFQQVNLQANLSYQRTFGYHDIHGLLLFNQTSRTAPSSDELNNYIPDNFRGYTARISYNYRGRYIVEANAAYNGTDKFVSANRYGLFPAVSVGWNMGEEQFMERVGFIGLLKLRASYGSVGSDDIGGYRYAYEEVYNRGGSFSLGESHNNFVGIFEGTLGNSAITWEKERKANVGLDFSLFNGKLEGTVEAFTHKRRDILTNRKTISAMFGLAIGNLPPVNIGKVSNRGYEVDLHYRGQVGQLGIELNGNYSFAKNRILAMDEPEPKHPWQRQTGLPIGMVRQWLFDGFYTAAEIADPAVAKPIGKVGPGYLKYRDLNDDGIIDVNDRAYVGNPNLQNTTIGMGIGFSYRRLTLNVLLQAAINFDVQIGHQLSTPWNGNLQRFHLKRWTPETAETAEFPALITDFVGSYMGADQASTFWVIPGDYLRVRSCELSYQLPMSWLRGVGLSGARLYVNGYNLLTWSKTFERFQYDPEVASGLSNGVYPQQKIYNTGIAISF